MPLWPSCCSSAWASPSSLRLWLATRAVRVVDASHHGLHGGPIEPGGNRQAVVFVDYAFGDFQRRGYLLVGLPTQKAATRINTGLRPIQWAKVRFNVGSQARPTPKGTGQRPQAILGTSGRQRVSLKIAVQGHQYIDRRLPALARTRPVSSIITGAVPIHVT